MDRTTANGNGKAHFARVPDAPVRDRSAAAVALDELVRQRLRVNDPDDAGEIAAALERAYPFEKVKLSREAGGMPVSAGPTATADAISSRQLRDDGDDVLEEVEVNVQALLTDPLLANVQSEIRAWGEGIRKTISDGIAAARLGLDPRQRERVFATRRTLGDYARLVRYAGALTPNSNALYRELASSLDQAASIALVALGDAIGDAGLAGARFLLQSPSADLRSRRDAVITALRALVGTANAAPSPDGWPRGVIALRQLTGFLQEAGHGDLEPLLDESYLARQLDSLVHAAGRNDPDNARAVASGAEPTLNGLRRFVLVCRGVANPQSPTLEAFRVALQHFLDPFEAEQAASGYRLPFIARAPLLLGRFAGLGGPDVATTRLMTLCSRRFELAEATDHFLEFAYADDLRVGLQVLLDASLHDFDRAIDLYALGIDTVGNGAAEWRAAAYGYIAYQVLAVLPGDVRSLLALGQLRLMCDELVFWQPGPLPVPPVALVPAPGIQQQFAIGEELALRRAAEARWYDLVRSLAPRFVAWTRGAAPATTIPFIDAAGVMANAPVIPPGFTTAIPRDVSTLLEVVI